MAVNVNIVESKMITEINSGSRSIFHTITHKEPLKALKAHTSGYIISPHVMYARMTKIIKCSESLLIENGTCRPYISSIRSSHYVQG